MWIIYTAVQKEKGLSFKNINNGELFGLQNLFKLTAQKVEIAEIMANKPGKRPLPFEVKGVKEVDFGEASSSFFDSSYVLSQQ